MRLKSRPAPMPHLTGAWPAWLIIAAATSGVILRPFGWPECIWAVAGAAALVATGLLPWSAAVQTASGSVDVLLFLTGMMLLAELARAHGLFEWLAAIALGRAGGSAARLFTLVFLVGTVVTVFLSNDATAVVLTPAVATIARAARARDPLPYLFACAFIANAASFVLPISNPANLVLYGDRIPALLVWLAHYGLASAVAILATYTVLRLASRAALRDPVAADIAVPTLSPGARMAGLGIIAAATGLLAASALGARLGAPTCAAGVATAFLVLARTHTSPAALVRGVSWGILPLVTGLFVMVAELDRTGVTALLAATLHRLAAHGAMLAALISGTAVALASNLVNNLPAGLLAGRVSAGPGMPEALRGALVIGVDLGPNLSVTGSLATILWLAALRREGITVSAWRFLRLGALVMPPALLLALAAAAI